MQSHMTLGFVLLCALASSVSSARIRQRRSPKDKMGGDDVDCEEAVSMRVDELMERIGAYYQQCEVNDDHVTFDGLVGTVNDEGKELLCAEKCQSFEEFATDAPDSSDLIKQCSSDEDVDDVLITQIRMHDAFDAARKACAGDEDEAPLLDYVEDLDTDEDATGKVEVEPKVVDNLEISVDVTPPVVSPKPKPEVVDVPVDVPVDIPVQASPVAPLKGNMVKQLKFEYELKGALEMRSAPSCDTLKKVFRKCDYRGTNKVFIKQIDNMLDKLSESQKMESMRVLHEVYKKVKKDAETDAMTFKDWTLFKLSGKESTKCALEYAMGK